MKPEIKKVMQKLQHMKKVNINKRTSFRVDSIALSLQMDINEAMTCLKELEVENLVKLHLPTGRITNHAVFAGEVTLLE